jgi:transposase-like protein
MASNATGWHPPHCPNPNCTYFMRLRDNWRFKRKGFYARHCSPHRIQRFTCLACQRTFSSQTFSTTYWQKRPELAPRIFSMVVGCMGNRQMARALGCSPSTVAHHIARLGRHSLLVQADALACIRYAGEVAIDGFESFEWSQYFPFHHNVAVAVESGYFLFHTDSPLRRKGRMTAFQKTRRAALEKRFGRAHPRAVEEGVRELLETLRQPGHSMVVRSDDHRAYPRAIRRVPAEILHRVTPSRDRRDPNNPLWEVNLLDLMIRHSTASHKRETIAWAKRRQASVEKLAIFQVWRNYIKKRREKGGNVTAAMLMGLTRRPWRVRDVLAHRRFFDRVCVPPPWQAYYRREIDTRALPTHRRHALAYAF